MSRRSAVLVALLLAALVSTSSASAAHTSAAERITDDVPSSREPRSPGGLLVLAQRLIIAQNNRLISPDAALPQALAKNAIANDVVAVNDSRRIALNTHGMRYTTADTAFSNDAVGLQGLTARVHLVEDTRLTLAYTTVETASLPDYQYQQTHDLTFQFVDGRWTLVAHQTGDSFPLAPTTDEPVNVAAYTIDADDERMESEFAPRIEALATGTKTLNRSAIVGYAWAFVGTYLHTSRTEGYNNAQYRPYAGNDCTNFVSQALKYGGWTEKLGFYTSNGAWWYNTSTFPLTPGASYTWGGAQNWSNFVSVSGRGYLTDSVKNLQRGDILQADWNNDGIADHTMIVTKRDTQGNIFLTYHSKNELDRSFWDLDAAQKKSYPKLTYRRWRLRDQFN